MTGSKEISNEDIKQIISSQKSFTWVVESMKTSFFESLMKEWWYIAIRKNKKGDLLTSIYVAPLVVKDPNYRDKKVFKIGWLLANKNVWTPEEVFKASCQVMKDALDYVNKKDYVTVMRSKNDFVWTLAMRNGFIKIDDFSGKYKSLYDEYIKDTTIQWSTFYILEK